jgi:hypothetical protein
MFLYQLQGAQYARLTSNLKKKYTQQAKMINNFKSAKQKLLQTNALIWFNLFFIGEWFYTWYIVLPADGTLPPKHVRAMSLIFICI